MSLHEAFNIIQDSDDTSVLREVFLKLLLEEDNEIQKIVNQNLSTFIKNYCNQTTLDQFTGRTLFYDANSQNYISAQEEEKKQESSGRKTLSQRCSESIGSSHDTEGDVPKLIPIYAPPEFKNEEVNSDLLQRLMVFIQRIREIPGLWREHIQLIKHLTETIHLFYLPEIHRYLVPIFVEFI